VCGIFSTKGDGLLTIIGLKRVLGRSLNRVELPGIYGLKLVWNPLPEVTHNSCTAILLAEQELAEVIEACAPYAYPLELVTATKHVILTIQGLAISGQPVVKRTELTALALTPQEQWAELGIWFDEDANIIVTPDPSVPEYKAWRSHVQQVSGLAEGLSPTTTLVEVIVAPTRVPLTGTSNHNAYIGMSCGWSNTNTARVGDLIRRHHNLRGSGTTVFALG
jgi:hypothetical protein